MTSPIRQALDDYPLTRWLRRGAMDLRPSLAHHLEANIAPPPPAPDRVKVLVGQLDQLIAEWRLQAQQYIEQSHGVVSIEQNSERTAQLLENANELDQLLNEGKS